MAVIVKICANKSIHDAKMCIEAGADIAGILVGQMHASEDFVDPVTASKIAQYCKGKIEVAVVTHLKDAKSIINICRTVGNSILQLHSDIDENEVEKIVSALPKMKLIRLIQVTPEGEILTDVESVRHADCFIIDSCNKQTDQVGGTGLTHDWNIDRKVIMTVRKPVIIAGGLNPNNVAEAIMTCRPAGVDVNSGCKNEKGIKDRNKVIAFVRNAKKG